jgi:hypothetical protein
VILFPIDQKEIKSNISIPSIPRYQTSLVRSRTGTPTSNLTLHTYLTQTTNMPSTYAAYYNIVEAKKHSAARSRRVSKESDASVSSTQSNSFLKRALDQLRPTEEKLTPNGIYAPMIQKKHLFSRN